MKRDDILDIAKYASSKLVTALSPSGSRITKDVAQKIKDAGIRAVSISVDGPELSTTTSGESQGHTR
ncbi:hypothetical protein [Sulfuracidifex tepidarius]|uniref:hypothetical protein n=1 Tax=Sulfuracidifex tepidarius TaxID=1294262 RepID=UPI000B25FE59|nr:hypothetical protein [Sulfuracidifex tepidarius]